MEEPAVTGPPEPPLIELALYVNPRSVACLKVQKQIESVLEGFDGSRVAYGVRDVTADVDEAEADRVIFTPTLVKRGPGPPAWFVGSAAGEMVAALLTSSGVEKTR